MAFKKLKLWFDEELADMLARKIKPHYKEFKSSSFKKKVKNGVEPLELKDRVELIADELKAHLPEDYLVALEILNKTLGPENEEETGMFTEYYWLMPMAKFIEKYGLDNYKESTAAIKELTKRNTGEYCIRPFIEKYPAKTIKLLLKWSKDKNKHVRRLASEGCRPRLPWASKISAFIEDPSPVIPILENLKDDPSKYVQKSVANHLNDILKDNRAVVMKIVKSWIKGASKERAWIIKHAFRNLRKKEDAEALKLISKLPQK